MKSSFYPPSPSPVPASLTRLSFSYNLRAALAIASVVLFFVLYVLLVAGMAKLIEVAIFYEMGRINKFTILLKLGAIAGAVMLFVFTLKFIFKLRNPKIENRLKLNVKEHPELMAFIFQICEETGAPKPGSVYVDPDVNAYVSYTNPWLSLILPVRKDLTIGMGLINCLTMTEFKAVIAHEFGHFAQRSMKIGSYLMSANTIIHDMIFTRDRWDRVLEQWRETDIRLSAAAWVITPVIWLIRQTLNLFYQMLNILYSSLSREMEFNADKVAVSVTGSEAIVAALWKLESGFEQWNNTLNHAYLASQKAMFATNLYEHNQLALTKIAPHLRETLNTLPAHPSGGKQFFTSSEHATVSMYASHPPGDQREASAKSPFIPGAQDDRSPWMLFHGPAALQTEMTRLIYTRYLGKAPEDPTSASDFEAFIEAESQGKDLAALYLNTFENRFLAIPEAETLQQAISLLPADLTARQQHLKSQIALLMQPVQAIDTLMETARQIAQGTTKQKDLFFEGNLYSKKELEQVWNLMTQRREELFNTTFKEWDADFCALSFGLAQQQGKEPVMKRLMAQHAAVTHFYQQLLETRGTIFAELAHLQQIEGLSQSEVNTFGEEVRRMVRELNKKLQLLDSLDFEPLPNIQNTRELREAVIEQGAFAVTDAPLFEAGRFDLLAHSLDRAIQHCQRLDQKNMAAILSMHAGQ